MENDDQLRRQGRNSTGKQPDNHNSDHRNIIKSGEYTNNLPQPFRGKLQHRRHHKGEQGNYHRGAFGHLHQLFIIHCWSTLALFQW